MASETLDALKTTTDNLRTSVTALEAEEKRLGDELATVKSKRQAVAKALAALEDTTPKRRRGRPRKTAASESAEPVAA